MPDVIITPFSGRMDFSKTEAGTSVASIVLDSSSNDLTLSTTSGNLVIGDASRDVYVGNGVANVDIVFEQDGEIRGLTNKTVTIGQTDSFVDFRTSKTTFSTGNVSIGTTGPSGRLHIRDDTSNPTLIIDNRSSTNDPLIRVISDNSIASFGLGIDNSDSEKFKISFGANNAAVLGTNDYLTILTGGNIGIGTSTPSEKLDVFGNLILGTQANRATISYTTNTARTLTIPNIAGNRTFAFIDEAQTFSAAQTFSSQTTALSSNSAILSFSSATGPHTISTAGSTDLFLSPGRNVGVGTSSPSGKLHIRHDSADPTLILDDRLGTTDPCVRFIPSAASVSFSLGIDDSDSDKFKLSFGANNTSTLGTNDYLTITTGGNLGLGVNSPIYKLDISGDLRTSGNLYVSGVQKQLIVSTSNLPIGSDYACMKASGGNFTTFGQFGGFYFQDRTPVGSGWQWYSAGGILKLYDHTNSADKFQINANGTANEWGVNGAHTSNITFTINSISSASRPSINVVNANTDTTTASNGRTFHGWLPIAVEGTTKWIPLYN